MDQTTLTVIALVVLALAALYAFFPRRTTALAPAIAPARRPGRLLIDHFEEAGRDAAGREVETQLGKQKAAEIARSMAAAFASPAPAPEAPKA